MKLYLLNKRQFFSIGEQILLSASNMMASIAVIHGAGIRWFGIYSFIFAVVALISSIPATMLQRQMVLEVSTYEPEERRNTFLATIQIQALLILGAALIAVLLLWSFRERDMAAGYWPHYLVSIFYVLCFTTFELFRQYLYVLDQQVSSFRCTLIFSVSLGCSLLFVLFFITKDSIVVAVYAAFCISYSISITTNYRCWQELYEAHWKCFKFIWTTFKLFFNHSRYRLVGLFMTWIQNQSMNPFLMLIGGPLIAGYFSLARLLTMPMPVISQGLVNASIPGLRRTYKKNGSSVLLRSTIGLAGKNLIFTSVYVAALAIAHVTGILQQYIPEYEEARWYLLIWTVTVIFIMNRFWFGQYFVIRMRFRFLMNVSIVAVLVSISGMFIVGYLFQNAKSALTFVLAGELVSIALFLRSWNLEKYEEPSPM